MDFAKELSEYYLLNQAINDLERRITCLESQLCASPKMDKISTCAPSGKNITEEKYINLISQKESLQQKKSELAERKVRIEICIDSISDTLIRTIAIKRVIEKKRFRQIAQELGGNNTEDSVKKMYYRHVLGINNGEK